MNTPQTRTLWVGAFPPPAEVLEKAGLNVTARAASGTEGLRLLRECAPEAVLISATLPGMDGLRFAELASATPLNTRPALLILSPSGMALPGRERLSGLNAAIVPMPATPESLRNALEALRSRSPKLPRRQAARLEALLDALGVPRHPGRESLALAVALAWQDRRKLHALGDVLYPETGALCGKSAAQVERAIRHVIDAAWRDGDMVQQQRIFGDTIDARRGRPTCGEMIAQLADILRWEG